MPNEHERDDTVSLRLDDSRGSNFRQQFTFGFHRLTDRYNDNEPLRAAAAGRSGSRTSAGPPPAVYFVALVNPNAPPSVIPPGLTLVQTFNYFGGDYDSLNLTERKDRRISGHAFLSRRRAGLRLRLSGPERQSFRRRGVAHQ